MSATTIRELLVKLGVDADTKEVKDYDAAIEKAKGHMEDIVAVAKAVAAAVATVATALVASAVSTGQYAEQVQEQAAALGVTTDAYQELSFAASRYGIDAEKITVILSKLAVDQKAIADGNKEAAETYAMLGLSVEEVARAKPEELFALLADGFGKVTSASDRLAIASTLFGDRIAGSLLPMLAGGSAGLRAMADEAHALGIVMSEEAIARSNEFNDQVEILTGVVAGLWHEIGLALIPTLTRLSVKLIEWFKANKAIIQQEIEKWAGRAEEAIEALERAVAKANAAVKDLGGWSRLVDILTGLSGASGAVYVATKVLLLAGALLQAAAAAATLVGGGGTLIAILGGLLGSLLAILTTAAQWAALFLLVEDFVMFVQGTGDTAIGRFVEKFEKAEGILGSIARLFASLRDLGLALAPILESMWAGFMTGLEPAIRLFEFFADIVKNDIVISFEILSKILDVVTSQVQKLSAIITNGAELNPAVTRATQALPGFGVQSGLADSGARAMQTLTSLAPTATGGQNPYAGASKSVALGGDTITINGIGMTMKEVEALFEARMATKQRLAAAALNGSEV
jgi:hypothetical protein